MERYVIRAAHFRGSRTHKVDWSALLNKAWSLESKREWGGRGVKEKNNSVAAKDGVSPSMTNETVVKEKQSSLVDTSIPAPEMDKLSSLDDTTILGSFPPLSTSVTTTAGNALGKSSYASVTGKPSGKKLNIHTLFKPGGYGIDVVVPVESIRAISDRFTNITYSFLGSGWHIMLLLTISMDGLDAMLENGPWFIRNNSLILKKCHSNKNLLKEDVSTIPVWVKLHSVPVIAFSNNRLSVIATKLGTPFMLDSYTSDMRMQFWGRSSYARVMIELQADVELKDNIVVVMPRIKGEGYYTCNIRVEYEWKPPRFASCKVFGHVHEECPKNIGAGATKKLKKPSQTLKGIPTEQKMGPKQVFQPVSEKSTANTSGKKMNNLESIQEVSKSNPFEVLTSVDNDVDLGTNGGISNSADKEPIMFVDDDGNPLVPTGIMESDSEVEVIFDETANLRISTSVKDGSDKGYGTNSLLEQWRDSY
nr:hypothetical protein [Tanacetum cinerariifolium]